MSICQKPLLKMLLSNFESFPIFPFTGYFHDLFYQFFLICINGAAKAEVFQDFVNELDFGVVAIENAECLFGFGLEGLLVVEFEH